MLFPAFAFTTLLCLQAILAQSAPQIRGVPDEESIIDALAAMQESSYPGPAEGSQFSNDEMMAILNNLQSTFQNRQFAYTPKDPRFYLAREDFPEFPTKEQEESEGRYKSDLDLANVGTGERSSLDLFPPSHDDLSGLSGQQQEQPEYHYMKKDPLSLQLGERMIDAGGEFMTNPKSRATAEESTPDLSSVTEPEKKTQTVFESHDIHTPSHLAASRHDTNLRTPSLIPLGQDTGGFFSNFYYVAIIAGCSAAAVVGVVAAGICWYRIHERVKAAADVDYPAYGVTGPSKDVSPNGGDRKLAQSAHMYHYQHQKQQMAALQKTTIQEDRQGSGGSDVESEDDNEDGDYTVYECPGLAGLCNTGEMEVKNPLYDDEPTPATPHVGPTTEESSSSEAAQK